MEANEACFGKQLHAYTCAHTHRHTRRGLRKLMAKVTASTPHSSISTQQLRKSFGSSDKNLPQVQQIRSRTLIIEIYRNMPSSWVGRLQGYLQIPHPATGGVNKASKQIGTTVGEASNVLASAPIVTQPQSTPCPERKAPGNIEAALLSRRPRTNTYVCT